MFLVTGEVIKIIHKLKRWMSPHKTNSIERSHLKKNFNKSLNFKVKIEEMYFQKLLGSSQPPGATLMAGKWLLTRVDSFMLSQD